jgi:DNA invertase Pin-like site-specific DNA recombinase
MQNSVPDTESSRSGRIYAYVAQESERFNLNPLIRKLNNWALASNVEIHEEIVCDTLERSKLEGLVSRLEIGDSLLIFSYLNAFKTARDLIHYIEEICLKGTRLISVKDGGDIKNPHDRFSAMMMYAILDLNKDMQEENGLAILTTEQFEAIKAILTEEQLEKLEPYFSVVEGDI